MINNPTTDQNPSQAAQNRQEQRANSTDFKATPSLQPNQNPSQAAQNSQKSANPEHTEEEFEKFVARSFDFAREDDAESLKIMLDYGLNVNLANHKGDSLLMLASYHNSLECARLLLERGAFVDQKNNRNQTPLAGVCFKGYYEMAELLLKHGAKVDEGSGLTPLNCAIMFQRREILDLLLKHSGKKLGFWQKIFVKISMLFAKKT
ncbi:ankyrin repeat protein [Helicobacter mustelae]|nr:ankyrin repeat protein [Helicobacter mustelae]